MVLISVFCRGGGSTRPTHGIISGHVATHSSRWRAEFKFAALLLTVHHLSAVDVDGLPVTLLARGEARKTGNEQQRSSPGLNQKRRKRMGRVDCLLQDSLAARGANRPASGSRTENQIV